MPFFTLSENLRRELRQRWASVFHRGRWLLHLLIWTALLLWLHAVALVTGTFFSGTFLIILGGAAGFNYTFVLALIPYARHRRSMLSLLAGLGISAVFWAALLALSLTWHYNMYPAEAPDALAGRLHEPLAVLASAQGGILLLIWSFFACYYFVDLYDHQKHLNRYQRALTDKLRAETTFLQTQVNPHFLFNTLNNIYLQALKESGEASVITRRLKDLLHYMLYDCSRDRVALTGEIAFLKNYVGLEELRNRQDAVNVSFEVKGNPHGLEIAPLLLINFIENAFKHGVKGGIGAVRVAIRLYIMEDTLVFAVSNTKPPKSESPAHQAVNMSGGIGIRNVRRRLEILYPNTHSFGINESESDYSVQLSIRL